MVTTYQYPSGLSSDEKKKFRRLARRSHRSTGTPNGNIPQPSPDLISASATSSKIKGATIHPGKHPPTKFISDEAFQAALRPRLCALGLIEFTSDDPKPIGYAFSQSYDAELMIRKFSQRWDGNKPEGFYFLAGGIAVFIPIPLDSGWLTHRGPNSPVGTESKTESI